ncbi:MAG: hypothetical protein Ct9H300mP16_15890 [Pseudomonadota bacterium]|nr:MAG: hypothetical protein Ct9H300mP16_15890 [Pseudomonadota bacterium]
MRSSWCVRPGSAGQRVVAEVSATEWSADSLYQMCRGAWPYRHLSRERFDQSSACWLTVIRRAVVDGTPIYTWSRQGGCADGEARAWWR